MLVFDCPSLVGLRVSLIKENGFFSPSAMMPFTDKDVVNSRSREFGNKCVFKISKRKATIFFTFKHNFTCEMWYDLGRAFSLWPCMGKACFFELMPDRRCCGLRDAVKLCCLSNFEATLDRTNELILLRGVMMRAHDDIMGNQCVFNKSVIR